MKINIIPWFETIKTIEITPEKFVDSCLYDELQEVILLANKKLSQYDATPVVGEKEPEKALPESPKTKRKLSHWTPEEVDILLEMWPKMKGQDIAFKLKKSYKSVMLYASRLGLSKYATDSRKPAVGSWKPARKPKPATEMAERNTDCMGKEINYPIY